MLMPLIKKDVLLVKEYSLGVAAIAVGLPLLLAWRQAQMGGMIGLLMAVLISSVAFHLAISEKENKYPKTAALLASTPYRKAGVVRSKYGLYFIIYAVCCVPSFVEMQFIPELAVDHFSRTAAVVFLIQAVCMGIFLPLQYKFGYEKTKFLSFLLFLSPFLFTIAESITLPAAIAGYLDAYPHVLSLLLVAFGMVIWLISFEISKQVVTKKDFI